jgi:glycosyltransferase involved in cell wall biosynthesis
MRGRILKHGAEQGQMVIVPPWPVQTLSPTEPASGSAFRAEHGLTGKFVVMYSGNHSIVHPLDTLLETAVRMKDRKDVVFLFIGAGLRVGDVQAAITRHQLTNVMHLPSQPRERLHESLSAANLHVVVMGNPMSGLVHVSKIYGALASGLPYVFVGPKDSHVVDLIKDSGPGFHVEHGDVAGFMEVIEKAEKMASEDLTAFTANRSYVAQHYSMEKSLDRFLEEVIDARAAALPKPRVKTASLLK